MMIWLAVLVTFLINLWLIIHQGSCWEDLAKNIEKHMTQLERRAERLEFAVEKLEKLKGEVSNIEGRGRVVESQLRELMKQPEKRAQQVSQSAINAILKRY